MQTVRGFIVIHNSSYHQPCHRVLALLFLLPMPLPGREVESPDFLVTATGCLIGRGFGVDDLPKESGLGG